MTSEASLGTADYVVAIVILVMPMGIGIWYAVRDANKATREEYLLGGRRMNLIPVALSIFITFQSAIAQIGHPAETFFYGSIQVLYSFGYILSLVVGYFTIVPLMYPLRITSLYEYLKLRYKSDTVRMLSTVVGMLTTVCYMAIALLAPALALEASAKLPLWMSIAVFGAVGTLYTAIGGIKSVIWTDTFQTVVVFVGVFVIIVKACIGLGGLGEVWRLGLEGGRLDFNRFTLDPTVRHTVWGLTIGHCFIWLVNGFNQSTLQRISSMKSLEDAKRAFLVLMPCSLIYSSAVCFIGLTVFAYFSQQSCDPYKAGLISNRNQVVPYFVLHTMTDLPGLTGLYVSALCCGALSTISSGINALAANTVEDILKDQLSTVKESTVTFITKLIVLVYGGIILGLTYLAMSMEGSVTQMANSVFGACGAPILGIFLMGGAVPWANKYGALTGLAASLAFTLWISLGNRAQGVPIVALPSIGTEGCSRWLGTDNSTALTQDGGLNSTVNIVISHMTMTSTDNSIGGSLGAIDNSPHTESIFPLYKLSYDWYSLVGTCVCIIVGLIVSYITNKLALKWNDKGGEVARELSTTESRLIFPFLRRFWGLEESEGNSYKNVQEEAAVRGKLLSSKDGGEDDVPMEDL